MDKFVRASKNDKGEVTIVLREGGTQNEWMFHLDAKDTITLLKVLDRTVRPGSAP